MSDTALPPSLADVSPSAKFIYRELQRAGRCTQAELRARTYLSGRTVRRALEELQARDVVVERPTGDATTPGYEVSE